MDHADIRGLVTAFHLSVAGLPRSSVRDHRADAHIAISRIPLIEARASRDPCVVSSIEIIAERSNLLLGVGRNIVRYSYARFDLAGDVPDEGREFTRDRHTDLVECELACREMSVALRKTQLRSPGDIADCLGLSFLTHLQDSAQPGREAVIPGRLHQHAPAWLLPVLVISPWRRLEPLEYSEGTNPRKPISSRGRAKR